jgi:hypothetical protein
MITNPADAVAAMRQHSLRLCHFNGNDSDGHWGLIANNGYPLAGYAHLVDPATAQILVDNSLVLKSGTDRKRSPHENDIYHVTTPE